MNIKDIRGAKICYKRKVTVLFALVFLLTSIIVDVTSDRTKVKGADHKVTYNITTIDSDSNGYVYKFTDIQMPTDSSSTYQSFLVGYPSELKLVDTVQGIGYQIMMTNTNKDTVANFQVTTSSGLSSSTVKSILSGLRFQLKDGQTFPPVGSEFGISVYERPMAFRYDENGRIHYYEKVDSANITWQNAYNAALDRTLAVDDNTSLKGHLATITSIDEQVFLYQSISKNAGWLGGTRALLNGSKLNGAKIPENTTLTYGNQWYWADGSGSEFYSIPKVKVKATPGEGYLNWDTTTIDEKNSENGSISGQFNYFSNYFTRKTWGNANAPNGQKYTHDTNAPLTIYGDGMSNPSCDRYTGILFHEPNNSHSDSTSITQEGYLMFAYRTVGPSSGWNDLANNGYLGEGSEYINSYYVEYDYDPTGKTPNFDSTVTMPVQITVNFDENNSYCEDISSQTFWTSDGIVTKPTLKNKKGDVISSPTVNGEQSDGVRKTFLGWYQISGGQSQLWDFSSSKATGDLNLTAVWYQNSAYTVTIPQSIDLGGYNSDGNTQIDVSEVASERKLYPGEKVEVTVNGNDEEHKGLPAYGDTFSQKDKFTLLQKIAGTSHLNPTVVIPYALYPIEGNLPIENKIASGTKVLEFDKTSGSNVKKNMLLEAIWPAYSETTKGTYEGVMVFKANILKN